MAASKHRHTDRKKRRRWPWVVLLVLVAIVALARLSLKTSIVHRWVRSQIIQAGNEALNAKLEIRQVKGDLWKEIRLVGVEVTNADTLMKIDSLRAVYTILSYFEPVFFVEKVDIYRPALNIVHSREKGWNIRDLVKSPPVDLDTTTAPFHWRVARFSVVAGEVEGRFRSFEKDSLLAVREVNIEGEFGYYGEEYELQLRELDFNIVQSRLSGPVKVQTEAQSNPSRVTLENLLVATGTSMVRSSATLNLSDSSAEFSISAHPLSWRDISAYLDAYPIQQNLQLDLGVKGNLSNFEVSINAQADGLREFELTGGFTWTDELALRKIDLSAGEADLRTVFSKPSYPRFRNLRISAAGTVLFTDYRRSELTGRYTATGLRQGAYRIDSASGSFSLKNGRLQAGLNALRSGEEARISLTVPDIWNTSPSFKAGFKAQNIQPAYWMEDPAYEGDLDITGALRGRGYEPGSRFWEYELTVRNSRMGGQQFSLASFRGTFNRNRFNTRSTVRLEKSEFRLKAEVDNYRTVPAYRYDLEMLNLNMAECKGLEGFSTAINGRLEGNGRFITPEKMELTSSVRIDSSVVNGEFIEGLDARLLVRDTVAHVDSARLRSAIADGGFDARIHLLDLYDIENRLDLDMQIKDVRSLAPLMGVENLQTKGEIKGTLHPIYGDDLQFSATVSLADLVYGDSFRSEQVDGEVRTLVIEEPEYMLNLTLTNPVINSVVLQDVDLTSRGKAVADSTYGDFQLVFRSASDSRIQHFGSYRITDDSIDIHTIDLQMISEERSLKLDRPFDAVITGAAVRVDTVRLASDDGAYIEFAIPHADSLNQRGYLTGHELNLTTVQNTLLNRSYFEGILSGRIYLERVDTMISSTGDLKIEDLIYRGTRVDSLKLKYELGGERLEGGMNLYDGRERLAEGQLRVPFKLGDPNTFSSTFFQERADGYLRINTVAASRFKEILNSAGITNTDGVIQFNGTLTGRAGEPEIEASFRLTDARVSGVAVDTLSASLNYVHEQQMVNLQSTVISLNQKAAEINAQVPVFVDLKNLGIELPGEEDSIFAEIITNRFDLASLNDFVSRTELREISGSLDGRVIIMGSIKDLKTDGKLNFTEGAVRIMRAGIKIDNIRSTLTFDRNTILVERFRARSNKGQLTAEGTLDFEQLAPSGIDIKINASNFRIANTSEHNAIINVDAQLGGTFSRPSLQGEMSFVSGYLYLQNFGERSVETVDLEDATSTPAHYDYNISYDSLSLDMDVSFNRRFFVRNRRFLDLEYELSGQLDLLKDAGKELQLFGTLSAVNGYARPLGKRFQLEEGTITFVGEPANPTMNIRHLFEPPQPQANIRIWYIIEGSVEDPQFKYESDPPMELENIISYTLFGQPFYALDSWKQVVASSGSNTGAADVAMDVLLDKVEALATQKLGIDVVQIDNTRTGGNTGTSIKTGWYLNPKVFFAIQNEITGTSPETIFILEYLLRKNLKLILTQGSDSSSGVDLNWNYDY